MVQVFEIESRTSFTRQEIRNSWHKPSKIQKRLDQKIDAVLEWEASNGYTKCYIRGLEHYTHRGEVQLKQVIERCVNGVLDEQDRANQQACATTAGTQEKIKAVSQTISMFSVELALIRARKDEIEAKRIYQKLIQKKKKKKDKKSKDLQQVLPTAAVVVQNSTALHQRYGDLEAMKRKLERICHYRNTILA